MWWQSFAEAIAMARRDALRCRSVLRRTFGNACDSKRVAPIPVAVKTQGNAEMDYQLLDADELLVLSIDAIAKGLQADAMVFLKSLLARDAANTYAIYLLAAQHAQLGMADRAEQGFRKVVENVPELSIARFQYGQLLMGQGRSEEAADMLAPILEQVDDLGAYARALNAAGQDRIQDSLRELDKGLELPQSIPALTIDMRRLREQLGGVTSQVASEVVAINETPAAMFLTGYGRSN